MQGLSPPALHTAAAPAQFRLLRCHAALPLDRRPSAGHFPQITTGYLYLPATSSSLCGSGASPVHVCCLSLMTLQPCGSTPVITAFYRGKTGVCNAAVSSYAWYAMAPSIGPTCISVTLPVLVPPG
jgi:hypothetical protein